jgi:DNA repair protein RadD
VLTPRPYQSRVVEDLWTYFNTHPEGNPVVEACVGAGKSMMVAMIAQRAMQEFPGTRIVVIVPSKELLVQNVQELYSVWPEASAGVYSAAVGRKQLGYDLTYATIGSIYKQAHRMGRIDLILADECHGIATSDTGMWRQLVSDLRKYGSPARVVGLTGTPFRGNGVWLTHGDDPLFTHICSRVTIRELLDLGYLSPLTTVPTQTQIDTSSVRTVAGDYNLQDLAMVSDKDEVVQAACDEIVSMGAARKKWLAFAVNVAHAEHVCAALLQRGIPTAVVTGDTPAAQRDGAIADYRAGRLRCLVNVSVLTTGFNVRDIDFLVLLRATKSPVLYVQILGRALRTADGKADALIADFTDTIATLGPVDAIKGRVPTGGRKGEAPTKLCPNCGNPNPASATQCVECGHEFPPPERITHGAHASAAAVLSSQRETMFETIDVDDVRYRLHAKQGSPDSLRVEYYDGLLRVASEWVCLSHEGFARKKAEQWWRTRSTIDAIPQTTTDALEWLDYSTAILRKPAAVIVNKASKYPTIVSYQWQKEEQPA